MRDVVEVRQDGVRRRVPIDVFAEAELAPGVFDPFKERGGYDGPLAYWQGKPMRPDVALAFDRMERAARADGATLLISSGYRTDAEQAELFRTRLLKRAHHLRVAAGDYAIADKHIADAIEELTRERFPGLE